jgi:hypothetical protein
MNYWKTQPTFAIIELFPLNLEERLNAFKGHWGYYYPNAVIKFANGPPGVPRRHAMGPDGEPIYLRDNPKALHNGARKRNSSQFWELEIK